MASIMIVEDSESLALVYQSYLKQEGYRVSHFSNGQSALAALTRQPPDLMLLDLKLPDMDGQQILEFVKERELATAVVVITAHGSVENAIEAMRLGAKDFLLKPVSKARLLVTAENMLRLSELDALVETLHQTFVVESFEKLIGKSLPMQQVYRIIESAATSKATVFITGESGTGKELCAQALHQRSPRNKAPFVAINCAAIPRELMESEIFGHVKGAFTGAVSNREGAAERAEGGTLFLDELCEMDLDLQSKLLRFLQTGQFSRVGSSKLQTADVRIVCATNRDPLTEVSEGRFREDLYYRLHVIPLALPPLRERGDDVLLIAEKLLSTISSEENRQFRGFSSDVQLWMKQYPWPGNVRELENVLRNVTVLHDGEQVERAMLPDLTPRAELNGIRKSVSDNERLSSVAEPLLAKTANVWLPDTLDSVQSFEYYERHLIEHVVDLHQGKVSEAAKKLGLNPSTLYRKIKQWKALDEQSQLPV
ncbi:sigma-54-dependent transcriptional regulator [Corallincola platygyrae]|uniref:Sigma-54-dependent transcriptional regulator n=1 Tax=Corallincola platygyrae TaxID=1193278 RepID=A0ABW4XP57_9GAMM